MGIVSHCIQAIIGSKRVLDGLQRRFTASRVVALGQGCFVLPVTDELYDRLPGTHRTVVVTDGIKFKCVSPKLVSVITEASDDEAVAYVETEYFGGSGDQGAIVGQAGNIIFGPTSGRGAINSALRLLGVDKGKSYDEFEAVGLGGVRWNTDWLKQP